MSIKYSPEKTLIAIYPLEIYVDRFPFMNKALCLHISPVAICVCMADLYKEGDVSSFLWEEIT